MALNHDKTRLLSADEAGSVKLWDISKPESIGKQISTLSEALMARRRD